jgi:hypothetical protein
MVSVAWMLVFEGKYVSWWAVIKTYIVFFFIVAFILITSSWGKAV